MSFTLGEITHLNPKMENINDVQLSWYPRDARNLQLTEVYQWSDQALGGAKPSIEILHRVREAFLMASSPRRFLVRATFGHGKTHLALALANYFGGEEGTPEVANILAQLERTSPAKAQSFATFKENRAPYLVVRLSGEEVTSLPQAVVVALEVALGEQEASRNYKLDFWFDHALEGLEKLSEEQVGRANAFLEGRQTDLPTLCRGLGPGVRNSALFELARATIEHLTGFSPDLGRAVDLKALLPQIANDLCGEGKPFSGILVLFDEFSRFVKSYAQDYMLISGAPLQSLMSGIVNCGNLATFVGFSQYDLDADVSAIFNQMGAGKEARENIDKELNRLPLSERMQLSSTLELVLSTLLRQDADNFAALVKDDEVFDQIVDATDAVMRLYGDHYSLDMGWGEDKVQEVLSQGCFPFHPLTVALLCKSNLRGDESGARTVLQYLIGTFHDRQNAPALIDGVLNWVAPVSLVEEFGRGIVEDSNLWDQYNQALRNAGGEAPEAQKATLRAMLLHYVADLKVTRLPGSYERNIAVLSGQTETQAQEALEALHAAGYLKRDDTRGVYAFYPVGQDATRVETPLRQEVTAIFADSARLEKVLERAVAERGWNDQEVANAPGHQQDWAAQQPLLPRALFSTARLKKMVEVQSVVSAQLHEAPRAYVIHLIASTNDDLTYYKTQAQTVLDEALADFTNPPPVILCVPRHVQGNFVNVLVREQVLASWDAAKKAEVGLAPFDEVVDSVAKEIDQNHRDYVIDSYIAPAPYRSAVVAQSTSGILMSLSRLLKICIDQAYPFAPPFFTEARATTLNIKKATRAGCDFFLKGTFAGWESDTGVQSAGQTQRLYSKFLSEGGAGGWGIVDSSYRICKPTSGKVVKGWEELEKLIPPKTEAISAREVILKLLNAPYGYDANTASLLFCAWVGFNQKELEFKETIGAASGTTIALRTCLLTDPKKFLEEIMCNRALRIKRRDPDDIKRDVEQLIEKIAAKEPFTREDARGALVTLGEFADDDTNEARLIAPAQGARDQLSGDLKLAEDYAAKLSALQEKISTANSVGTTLAAFDEAQKPLAIGCVSPARVRNTGELTDEARAKVTQITAASCDRMAALKDIRDATNNRKFLENAKKEFAKRGFVDLCDRVDAALTALAAGEALYKKEREDEPFVVWLKAFKNEKGLRALREGLEKVEAYQTESSRTLTAIADAKAAMEMTLASHLAWYQPLEEKLANLLSPREFNAFDSDVSKYLDRFEGTPEGARLGAMQRRIGALGKAWDKLGDYAKEKPKNNDDLKKLGKQFDKLGEDAALSETQKAHIQTVRAGIDERFVAAVEAAEAELASYEARNESGEDPVALKNNLDKAITTELAYLSDDHKPRLRALHKSLQRRIDDDEIKSVEANFLKIQDPTKRRECLRILQKHLGMAAEIPAETNGTVVSNGIPGAEHGLEIGDASTSNGALRVQGQL